MTQIASQEFEAFVADKEGRNLSLYFNIGPFSSYVRRTTKLINGERKHIICRANTTNTEIDLDAEYRGEHKRTGLYEVLDTYMTELAKEYGYDGIEVECVQNPYLQNKLKDYGYICYDPLNKCYWKSFV